MATKDKIRSTQIAKLVDLVSEGEIEGLVAGSKSIYFDETPLQNDDGSFNFENVDYELRNGTNDQAYLKGFSSVENEVQVSTKVTLATAVTRAITNTETDQVRITLSVPALYKSNDGGGLDAQTVELKAELSDNGGAYVRQRVDTVKTKQNLSGTNLTAVTANQVSGGFEIGINISFSTSNGAFGGVYTGGNGSWKGRVEYKRTVDSTWVSLGTVTVSESEAKTTVTTTTGTIYGSNTDPYYASNVKIAKRLFKADTLAESTYEFRVIKETSRRASAEISSLVLLTGSKTIKISGSTQNKYQRSWEIPLTGTGPWNLRVSRITADNVDVKVQNDTYWDSMTQIIDAKLRYPNSAYIGLTLDAQQFDNLPVRGYDLKLLKVKVPVNYDPDARTYDGVWDGTFKTVWTDNPAWCFYDLCTNPRYGLGEYLNVGQIDKWALYTISQYCDQLIHDGFGGIEPRFTCNAYIQSRQEAYRVIQDMAAVFRAMTYWDTGALTMAQDSPSDAVHLFTNSNVENGAFVYSGSASKARHTVALVTWNDPDDLYRQKVEYVADDDAIARFGVIQTEIAAFGCTSRGQANRVGRWLLFAERYESEIVTFVTGMEGIVARPGAIIKVADSDRAGLRFGGRVSSSTTSSIVADSDLSIPAGTYNLLVVLADGTVETRVVTTISGRTITTATPFSSAPQTQAQWMLNGTSVEAQTFRIVSAQEQEGLKIQITALKHNPDKYAYVEEGLALQARPISIINGIPDTPGAVSITEGLYATKTDVLNRVSISWATVNNASKYRVVYTVDDSNEITLPDTTINTVEIADAPTGAYAVSVYSIGALGAINNTPATATATVLGKTAPPSNVANFTSVLDPFIGLTLYWDKVADVDLDYYDVRLGTSFDSGTSLGQVKANNLPVGLLPAGTQTYWIKALDTSGNYSLAATSVTVTVLAPDAPSVTSSFVGDSIVLNWTAEQGSLATQFYEIRYGASFAAGTSLGQIKGTTTAFKAKWAGSRTFWVSAVDSNGNFGAAGSVSAIVVVPSTVTVTSEIVDNNVLLRWGDATGTLPIDYYEIRRGATYAGGSVIGRVSARFSAIFESSGGVFTYWLLPVDVAGNEGSLSSVIATVSQPPDFQLLLNVNSTFNGTKTNFAYDGGAGGYVTPVNTTETFQQHFTNNSFSTPQAQVTAGYPIYVQPIGVDGSYEEDVDYGTVVPSTKISSTLTYTTVSGSVTVTPTISYRKLTSDPWTVVVGQTSVFASDFRYVRIRYDFVRSSATSLILVTGLNIKFDIKLKNDAGTATVNAADSGGTTVNFTIPFLDVSSITLSPLATTPLVAVYDFVDVANPTSFKILLYDSSGTRVSGTVGWSAKGV